MPRIGIGPPAFTEHAGKTTAIVLSVCAQACPVKSSFLSGLCIRERGFSGGRVLLHLLVPSPPLLSSLIVSPQSAGALILQGRGFLAVPALPRSPESLSARRQSSPGVFRHVHGQYPLPTASAPCIAGILLPVPWRTGYPRLSSSLECAGGIL